jgi:uncharacterized protein (TIGR03382 family)
MQPSNHLRSNISGPALLPLAALLTALLLRPARTL